LTRTFKNRPIWSHCCEHYDKKLVLVKVKDLMDEIGFNIDSENFTKTGLLAYNGKSL